MHEYLLALIGGMMIGLAAVMLMAAHGKIMGVSGIVSRVLPPSDSDWLWRVVFIGGVLAAPLIVIFLTGRNPEIVVTDSLSLLIAGGLLVGVGTVTGSGCTSGHGVCGLPRLSVRSMIATCVFMVAGFVTVFILRHVVGA